ncbi:MAG TPA: hypothetical protein VF755_03440 [Catenuloplanes sp.]|jgi:hypothetical protein
MPVRLCFTLPGALRLAEHATAAATNLRRPGTAFTNTPALRLVVEHLPEHPSIAYLLSCGVPCLTRPDGTPVALYPDPGAVDGWTADPHEVIDLNQLVPAGTVTGRALPIAHGWYLPLRAPGEQPLIEVMRAAVNAGYTYLSIDGASLTTAVTKHRRRQPQPC